MEAETVGARNSNCIILFEFQNIGIWKSGGENSVGDLLQDYSSIFSTLFGDASQIVRAERAVNANPLQCSM